MGLLIPTIIFLASLAHIASSQQYAGDVIPNSLPAVPGSEITYFRINDPTGKNKNLTLINYYSHGKDISKRLVESNIQRAVVIIHGLNRDPGTYMSNMLSALAQVTSDPNVNFDTVAIIAPYFPNGDDKGQGYPWTDGLSAGKGSTSNALVWKASQWSAGGNNQYPSNSKNTSSYTVLDQIIQYFDNTTLFPKMKQIVIAGHSLGAQTVQRYAVIGVQLNTKSPVSYWIGNPNSYAWLSTDRPLPTTGCAIYDDYREGYSAFTDYPMTYGVGLVNSGRAAILPNYNSKAINYGRGTQDLGDDSSTCAPFTTGKDRNERFFNFIKAFPPTCSNPSGRNCDTVDFVNTGHDGGAMMASAAGQARLFLDNFYGNGNRSYDFGYPRQQAGDDPYPNPSLNTTAASINNNTYAGNMTYWGCWSDQNPQTLTNMTYQSNANTIDLCTQICASGNNTIAGMEFGTQCFCGSSLGYRAQQVIESSCQNTCPGNSNETCGGMNRLSIFSNGRPQLQPTPGTPETVGDFTYIACYTEVTSGRALTAKGPSTKSMTLEFCAGYCAGYQYFGTEYGAECYCGNSFAAGANRTNDDECNMLCANDPAEFCGAGNRLTVYQNASWVAPSSASSSSSAGASSTTSSGSGSQATAVSCPGSNNTVITSGGNNFTIECGIDHQGGDLTSLSVGGFQQCIDACAQNGQCVDVSLSGNACYLKSVLGAAIQNGGIWGAKLVADGSSTTTSSVSTTSSSSSTVVSSSSGTASASSTSPSASDTRTSTTSSSSTTSTSPSNTPVTCPASNDTTIISNGVSFLIECGIDHAGGDMKFLVVTSFQQCVDACATTSGCVDLSLSGNACYLKSTLGAAIRNAVWGAKVVQSVASSMSGVSTTSSLSTTSSVSSSSTASISATTSSTLSSSSSSGLGSTESTSTMASTTTVSSSTSSLSSSSEAAGSSTSNSASSSALSLSSSSSGVTGSSTSNSDSSSSSLSTTTVSDSSSSSTTISTSSSTSVSASTTSSPVASPSSSISVESSSLTFSTSSSVSASNTPSSSSTTSSALSSPSPSSSSSSSSPKTSSPPSTTLSTSTTSISSTTSPSSLPSGFSSVGCFIDSNTRLPATSNGTSSSQTPQQCALAYRARNFRYSATEYAQERWCGNTPPLSPTSVATAQCSMKCTGDKTQLCGAGNRLSVIEDLTWKQTLLARRSYTTWNLMGCYIDSASSRTLAKTLSLAAFGGAANATVANCLEACQAKGYVYCGEEYYSECYGSNSAPVASLASGADALAAGCDYPCKGNVSEACGGRNRMLVYVNNGTLS